ncbi:MAG: dihydrolipoamide acetyltransferase family protein [Thermoleophilia bacterium]
MTDVVAPKLGLTIERMEVTRWAKQVGDPVRAGEVVVELSADKADVEVESPVDGVVQAVNAAEGDEVVPGQVLAVVAVAGTSGAAAAAAPGAPGTGAAAPVGATAAPLRTVRPGPALRPDGSPVLASPAARRLARELGVDLVAVAGSGPGGRVVERDVQRAATDAPAVAAPVEAPAAPAPTADGGPGLEPARWSAARRATARRIAHSASVVAPVTLHRRAQTAAPAATVAALRAAGVPASFTHAILFATARALVAHPALNAVWQDERVLLASRVDLAVAVDVDGDLLAPVVRDAGSLGLEQLVQAAAEVVARARAREATIEELTGGTFTVSNLGMLGVEWFTPIVDHPQVAILGVGAIVDGRCHLSLTFDHRAVDGAPAARFLADLVDALETLTPHGA